MRFIARGQEESACNAFNVDGVSDPNESGGIGIKFYDFSLARQEISTGEI